MAEEAGSVALVAVDQLGEAASASTEWKESWEVEFSRFFNFPTVSSDSFASHSLKPMARYKTRVGGTWVTASSQARLQLVRLRADVDPVISVSIRGTTIVSVSPLCSPLFHFIVYIFPLLFWLGR